MTTDLNVPVALIVFNRPSHTETVFKTIASVRPKRLFIIADGPRPAHPTDATRCAQVRAVVQNVTWPCDVRTDFADANMGPTDEPLAVPIGYSAKLTRQSFWRTIPYPILHFSGSARKCSFDIATIVA